MLRKLDVAMGLVHRPTVLFLDEPTTGLDPAARAELWAEIGRLTRDGLTILLTTHYLEEADRLAGQLAIVDHGRIVASGTPDELKAELHGDAILVELHEPAGGARAAASLSGIAGLHEPVVDGRSLRARATQGATLVPAVLSALDAAGISVASITVARPVARRRLPPPHRAGLPPADRGVLRMTAVAQSVYMTQRHARVLVRQPWFLAITLAQPIIWLLLFGALFRSVTEIPGFGGGRLVPRLPRPGRRRHDRPVLERLERDGHHRGHGSRPDGPLPRRADASKLADRRSGRLRGDQPGPPVADHRRAGRPPRRALRRRPARVRRARRSRPSSSRRRSPRCSDASALVLRQRESVIGLNTLLVLPLTFVSAAFLPLALAPDWIATLARVNPVNWAVEAGREALLADADWTFILPRLGGLLVVAIACLGARHPRVPELPAFGLTGAAPRPSAVRRRRSGGRPARRCTLALSHRRP